MGSAALPRDKVDLVRSSFKAVAPSSEAVATLFYARLFMVAPHCRALFPQDMTAQKRKLMAMLAALIDGLDAQETILPELRALGIRHARYGAERAHYHLVGSALLFALEQTLGPDWTPELGRAWADTYVFISDVMQEAARAAA